MTRSFSYEEIEELAAGYVLGDLSSGEAEAFRRLLQDRPELQVEVAALQEALAMMPYGLDEPSPEQALRSQILSAAQAEFSPLTANKIRRFQPRLSWVVSTAAASLALVCGVAALYLSGQVRTLQARHSPSANFSSQGDINQTWSGLSQLLQDHQRSLANPEGPVDFAVEQVDEIPTLMQGFHTTVAALPLLPATQGKLLGGSNCQLGETQGVRLTYQLESDQTVSAYQLNVANAEFPEFRSAQITLQQPDGTGIVLWRDDDYLYALVAELPTAELQRLAYAIEGT